MLTIEHLTKCYGSDVKAVDDLSLTVMPGDIYGFIGHNGAGKTTTLRAVAGILSFDSGTITVDGKNIAIGLEESFNAVLGSRPRQITDINRSSHVRLQGVKGR